VFGRFRQTLLVVVKWSGIEGGEERVGRRVVGGEGATRSGRVSDWPDRQIYLYMPNVLCHIIHKSL
jgi:hypothetical protein